MLQVRPVFVMRFHALAGICVLVLAASSAQAGDEARELMDFSAGSPPPAEAVRPEPTRTSSFALVRTGRFLDGVNLQMEAMSAYSQTSQPGGRVQDNVMYEEHSLAVERSLLRSTRRAVRDYLMEVTAADRLIERYKKKGLQSVGLDTLGGSGEPGKRRRLGFDFGISHFRPEVGLEYEVGRSSFKFSVSGDGRVGVRFRDPRWGGNNVSVGYDGDDVFYVGWRVSKF